MKDTKPSPTRLVVLFDVDNTLLDNDRVTADLREHLDLEVGPERAQHYWAIFEQLRAELGYADYLGALQRYRGEYPHELHLLAVSKFLINYPFASRLYPKALEVIKHVRRWGVTIFRVSLFLTGYRDGSSKPHTMCPCFDLCF